MSIMRSQSGGSFLISGVVVLWHMGIGTGIADAAEGCVLAWGHNGYAQTNVPLPNCACMAIAAGAGHSLCLKADGSIVAWGQTSVPSPNTDFIAIAA
jgi:hypothetical protein